jgi:hypothetical protein
MIKLIVEVVLIIILTFIVLDALDPIATYAIINAIYPLPSTTTTTVTIPPTSSKTIYINNTNQATDYILKNNTVAVLNGQNNKDTMTTYKQVILYLVVRGGFNDITVKNAVLVLLVLGSHNVITLQNTTLLSSNIIKDTQIYNNTNVTNSTA